MKWKQCGFEQRIEIALISHDLAMLDQTVTSSVGELAGLAKLAEVALGRASAMDAPLHYASTFA
jgi:hypothetical protein